MASPAKAETRLNYSFFYRPVKEKVENPSPKVKLDFLNLF